MLGSRIKCNALQYGAIKCNAVQKNAMRYNRMLGGGGGGCRPLLPMAEHGTAPLARAYRVAGGPANVPPDHRVQRHSLAKGPTAVPNQAAMLERIESARRHGPCLLAVIMR